jgi:hypothetical protein
MTFKKFEPVTYTFTSDDIIDHLRPTPNTHGFRLKGYKVSAKKRTPEYQRLVDQYGEDEANEIVNTINDTYTSG